MRRVGHVSLIVVLLASVGLASQGATAGTGSSVFLVSKTPDGVSSNDGSFNARVSGDGQVVVFQSHASDLTTTADNNGTDDVFAFDRKTGVLELVSVNATGEAPNAFSGHHAINQDGRFVAFLSWATDLVEGGNAPGNLFLRDRAENRTVQLTGGGDIRGHTLGMTADGEWISFKAEAKQYDPNDQRDGVVGLFLLGVHGGGIVRVDTTFDGKPTKGPGRSAGQPSNPAFSADSRFLAFSSSTENLVPDDNNGENDIFVKDLETDSIVRVSVTSEGTQANGRSDGPTISGDGRYVVFKSGAPNLNGGLSSGLFVHDRDLDGDGVFDESGAIRTTRLNLPENANAPSLSANGRFIAFRAEFEGQYNDVIQSFRYDRDPDGNQIFDEEDAGATSLTLVSHDQNGDAGKQVSLVHGYHSTISSLGDVITFTSAARLDPADTTPFEGDVYAWIDTAACSLLTGEDVEDPQILAAAVERQATNRPFHVTLEVEVDDSQTGNSPIYSIGWRWNDGPWNSHIVPEVLCGRSTVTFDINVFDAEPSTANTVRENALTVVVQDASANQSQPKLLSWIAPRPPLYLALGDSFAAAWHAHSHGPPDVGSATPNDRTFGYPRYLHDELGTLSDTARWGFVYRNIAISGSSTSRVIAEQLGQAQTELETRSGSWNILTLTAGANDTAWSENLQTWYWAKFGLNAPPCPPQTFVVGNVIRDNIAVILSKLRETDPNARLIVTGYANPWRSADECYEIGDQTVSQLNAAIFAGVVKSGTTSTFVDFASTFRTAGSGGGGVGVHPYIQDEMLGWPHPNEVGHEAIAGDVFPKTH